MKESINTKSYNEYLWTNEIKKICINNQTRIFKRAFTVL